LATRGLDEGVKTSGFGQEEEKQIRETLDSLVHSGAFNNASPLSPSRRSPAMGTPLRRESSARRSSIVHQTTRLGTTRLSESRRAMSADGWSTSTGRPKQSLLPLPSLFPPGPIVRSFASAVTRRRRGGNRRPRRLQNRFSIQRSAPPHPHRPHRHRIC
jgi:hypothetical protein